MIWERRIPNKLMTLSSYGSLVAIFCLKSKTVNFYWFRTRATSNCWQIIAKWWNLWTKHWLSCHMIWRSPISLFIHFFHNCILFHLVIKTLEGQSKRVWRPTVLWFYISIAWKTSILSETTGLKESIKSSMSW